MGSIKMKTTTSSACDMLVALAYGLDGLADTTGAHETKFCYRLASDYLLQAVHLIRKGEDYESEGERCR